MRIGKLTSKEPYWTSSNLSFRFFWSLVVIVSVIAVLVRYAFLGTPGFPLGEGGLFIRFAELIRDNGFAVPAHAAYGDHSFPFAYPPAAFYLAAAISRLTGAGLFDIFYWLPLLLNLLAVPTFCFFAAQATRDRAIVAISAVLYVQLPHSFLWQITGGGLPRALGALISLLALGLVFRSLSQRSYPLLLMVGILVGFAILSHLEWGIFAASGIAITLLVERGIRQGLRLCIVCGLAAFLTVLPWVVLILARHGFAPFLSSSTASEWSPASFIYQSLTGQIFDLLVWPAMLGTFVCIRNRKPFLLLWSFVILLATPRMGISAGLAIPSALLSGYGIKAAGDFLRDRIGADPDLSKRQVEYISSERPWGLGIPVLALMTLASIILSSPIRKASADLTTLDQLDLGTREAMRWVARNSPADAKFVVVSDAQAWWGDRAGEWFPLLAGRESLTTAQGLEWAGPGAFVARRDEIDAMKLVQLGAPELLPAFIRNHHCAANYAALFLPRASPARAAFEESDGARTVFANQAAAVVLLKPRCRSAADPHTEMR